MTAAPARMYRLGELHRFEAQGRKFVYLVPAGAIFELDNGAARLMERLAAGEAGHDELVRELGTAGFTDDADELLEELYQSHLIQSHDTQTVPLANPPEDFPLQSLVMNLTNQCNL